ncbi:MAG: hypothetical protein R3B57_03380 [Phycisphaerales bacterium]
MGVINAVARMLGAKRAPRAGPTPPEPVAIDISDDAPDASRAAGALSSRKMTAETIAELQRNYQEVLAVVRKVDDHLDRQERRSERLIELADRTAGSLDAMPTIRDQGAELNEAIRALAEATRQHHAAQAGALARQHEAFDDVRAIAVRAADAEDRMTESLDGFRTAMNTLGESTNRLTNTLADLRRSDIDRERELARMLVKSNRATTIAVGAVAVMMVVTLIVVALAFSS